MGSIRKRKRKDGTWSFMAEVLVKRSGRVVHREARTFERKQAAQAWIKKTEVATESGGLEDRRPASVTLSEAIERYVAETKHEIGRTKAKVLSSIRHYDIADKPCDQIDSADYVAFARELSVGRGPSTVLNHLSHLSAVIEIAQPAWNYPLDRQAMRDARVVCHRLGLTAKSTKRERRPSLDELAALMRHFDERWRRGRRTAPMCRIIAFAIFSTRRQEEITRLRWADYEPDHTRVLVRDMKNPGAKLGNDIWCEVPPEARAIIAAMPQTDERIFPYGTDAISAAFTRACAFLGIEDLRFHDLRHEGVSRLFETGRTIPLVASISGHRSWQSLQRYTQIRQTGDKYEGWAWMEWLAS